MAPRDSKQIAFSTSAAGSVVALRQGGEVVSADARDKILARLAAGQHVEVELDITAYSQKPNERNANCVRFDDRALERVARRFVNKPFLRDHAHGDLLARGGTIIAADAHTDGRNGLVTFAQTVNLSAPWAVEMAARGLLDRFSISWAPVGVVKCSACGADIRKCAHWPGDEVDGVVVEAICTDGDPLETSAVNVPAASRTGIDDVRVQLSAMRGAERADHDEHQEAPTMSKINELKQALSLAAEATDEEVLVGVQTAIAKASELARVVAERDTLAARVKDLESQRDAVTLAGLVDTLRRRVGMKRDDKGEVVESASERSLRTIFARCGEAEARAFIDELPGLVEASKAPQSRQESEPPAPVGGPVRTLTDEQKATAASLGVTEEAFLATMNAGKKTGR